MARMLAIVAVLLCTLPMVAGEPNEVVFKAKVDGTEQRYIEILPPGFDANQTHHLMIALHGHGSDRWQFIRQSRP